MRPTGQYPGSIYDLRVVMRLSTCTNIIRNRNFLPFVSTWVHSQKFGAIQLLIVLVFCVVFFFILFVFILCLVPNVGCITDLSIIDWPFGSYNIYLFAMTYLC